MTALIIIVFILGYIAIALEHTLKLDKAAAALLTGVVCWAIHVVQAPSAELAVESLMHHLGQISSILFFLLGAMTIVELIDSHNGFDIIVQKIRTKSKGKLLVIITCLTFFLSAILDNLTTAIVMASLCSKILTEKSDKLWFCGMIVIAANAGGAWSPMGDVTTTMLWIGGQITAMNIVKQLLLPSLAVCIVPLLVMLKRFGSDKILPMRPVLSTGNRDDKIILFSGIAFLLFVPLFKTVTHLPPFMGILLALGMMWLITSVIHKDKAPEQVRDYTVMKALQKIDAPSILFFLGILLAVTSLESHGILKDAASAMNTHLKNDYAIGTVLGLFSALVDNVPLVAASQGMYDLAAYPTDHHFWEFLALTTGTGGSAVIIGSAAGVAVMGIEKIEFMWYLKRISWLALIGFIAGIAVFLLQTKLGL